MNCSAIPNIPKHIDTLNDAVGTLRILISKADCSTIEENYLRDTIDRLAMIGYSIKRDGSKP